MQSLLVKQCLKNKIKKSLFLITPSPYPSSPFHPSCLNPPLPLPPTTLHRPPLSTPSLSLPPSLSVSLIPSSHSPPQAPLPLPPFPSVLLLPLLLIHYSLGLRRQKQTGFVCTKRKCLLNWRFGTGIVIMYKLLSVL